MHGWDLATATGQPTDLDPEVGQLALDWGRENLKPQFRGDPGRLLPAWLGHHGIGWGRPFVTGT